VVTTLVIGGTVWSLFVYRLAWWGIIRSEQVIYADMRESTPAPPPPGGKLFFINLPIVAIYAPDAMREVWNVKDLDGYTLTFAPHPLVMNQPSTVERLNDHELLVSTPAPGYFSGRPGQMLIDGMCSSVPLDAGRQKLPDESGFPFDVTIVEADPRGVSKIKFSFHKKLDSPDYYFYVSSPARAAYRLQFDATAPPDRGEQALFARARSADVVTRVEARMEIRDRALPVAEAMASPVQAYLSLQSDDSLNRVEGWWKANGVFRRSDEMARWRQNHARELWERSLFFEVMDRMSRLIKSDLYLTGER